MSTLPKEKLLVLYWIPDVGIGRSLQHVHVPLTDILRYTLQNGQPQAGVVNLSFATFNGTPEDFNPPYINIPEGLIKELEVQQGQTESNVQKLQNQGIKVLLSVFGKDKELKDHTREQMGWDLVPSDKVHEFVNWLRTEVVDRYGLDGIDIDDEPPNVETNSHGLIDTVSVLRHQLSDKLITKALWQDFRYFRLPASEGTPNAGKYLGELLDIGSYMGYGQPFETMTVAINEYHDVTVDGINVGLPYDKICIGVQAGPGQWMTALPEVKQLTKWSVEPQSPTKPTPPILGMMLFTFTQDIQQWDHAPQNSPGYSFPNPDDHQWQKAIIEQWWGSDNWIVSVPKLLYKLAGTIWTYRWRGNDYEFGFGRSGDAELLESWKGVRWRAVSDNEVVLDGLYQDHMYLHFDDTLTHFQTNDWDGEVGEGTRTDKMLPSHRLA